MGSVLVKKPNILVFVLDQLSFRALDLYGGYCSMPFITSLAKDGITVSDCYCSYSKRLLLFLPPLSAIPCKLVVRTVSAS